MIRRFTFLLLTAALILSVVGVSQAQQPLLTRHTRQAVTYGQAATLGRMPATQTMQFDIVLALRHAPELENLLQELYDPTSPNYRKFVTVKEFTDRFGPSQEDYDGLIAWAKASGFHVLHGSRDGMDVQLKGTVAAVEKALHITMALYQHPTENRTFYAPDREPTVDLPFQLWHISGLDNYSIPKSLARRNPLEQESPMVKGSCPGGYYCGSDMRAAYYGNGPLTGAGQYVGLFQFAGFNIADVNTYYKNAKQTLNVPVVGVSTDGTSINCSYPNCDDAEQTLDIVQAASMAPGLATIYVFVGSSETAILSSMSTYSPLPLNMSASWMWTPADPDQCDPYFQKFAAQGQTFFPAAGDWNAWNSSPYAYPAEDAWVVGVGGTDLLTQSAGGPWASETGWPDSGGGISPDGIPIPSWQQLSGVINSQNMGSTTLRNGPDVAGESNFDFYVCADQRGCGGGWGGTSFAAPMWAGFMALINQQSVANGNPVLGFINPLIYPIGVSANYSTAFHDTTSGNNNYPAVTGYDLITGWGSPTGEGLINLLAGQAGPGFSLTANPSSFTLAQGSSGTGTITVLPSGGFSGSVTLNATGMPTGVTALFDPNPTATSSTLTLTVGSSVATGTYTITITGVSDSLTNQTSISLKVTPASAPIVTLTPKSLTFGNEPLGGVSNAKSVTMKNTGNAVLNISGIAPSGDFALASNGCGSTLAAGASCKFQVTFSPTQLGARSGTVTITDNAPDSPQTVALSGAGIAPVKLTPANANFPKTIVGTSSAAKTFKLANKLNATLTGISISTSGDFSVSATTCGGSLAAKSSCTISVVFSPTQIGLRTGMLQVSDSAVGSPQTSTLTGTGK